MNGVSIRNSIGLFKCDGFGGDFGDWEWRFLNRKYSLEISFIIPVRVFIIFLMRVFLHGGDIY